MLYSSAFLLLSPGPNAPESPRRMCRQQWGGIIHGLTRPLGDSQLRKEHPDVF
jgi:hypothetical protein